MKNNQKKFLTPTLEGDRFKTKSVPVEFLQELSVIQDLIFELAKDIYKKEHPTRSRLPNHFLDGISLRLLDIKKGSSIMELDLDTSEIEALDLSNDTYSYLEKAKNLLIKDLENIDIEDNNSILSKPKYANYFIRIGRHLRPNETMFLNRTGRKKYGKLTDDIRAKVLNRPYVGLTIDKFEIYADVTSIDKKNQTFTISESGLLVSASLALIDIQLLVKSLADVELVTKVLIKGTGKFDSTGRLQVIDRVDEATLIDPYDVHSRIDELMLIKDGWLDGEGKAPNKKGLLKLLTFYDRFVPKTFIKPAIFPRPDGNIQFEWSSSEYEIDAVIDLMNFKSRLHALNFENEKETIKNFDLSTKVGWKSMNLLVNEAL
ncbi:hypothetical protein [Pedobacter agri]|uniref:Uncharacterized protein n=1 Tax=Pedobacter agri TaxID=454586 RepID=A0A9X3I8G1_9SPHI|nr:hypothetical protein [Pedobacter agri]MCX3264220.1 hypothetical protein [Pedobacter agri]